MSKLTGGYQEALYSGSLMSYLLLKIIFIRMYPINQLRLEIINNFGPIRNYFMLELSEDLYFRLQLAFLTNEMSLIFMLQPSQKHWNTNYITCH